MEFETKGNGVLVALPTALQQERQIYQGVIDFSYLLLLVRVMKPHIAVVDDDIAVRESLESLIRSVGLSVRVFASAEEFLHSAHSGQADCLILDVQLPGMNGIELHRYLEANNWKVPVVFMTAHGYDERAKSKSSSDWAVVAYLNKPFSEDELLNAVFYALDLKSGSKQNSQTKEGLDE